MTTRNSKIRFCDNNFIDEDYLASNITYSSQLTGFPFSNARTFDRSTVWKMDGNFVITSTNKVVYITDGSQYAVLLTTGNYSGTALAAHIQTKLNAATSGWACTYNTDPVGGYTFKITHTGSATLRYANFTNSVWTTIGHMLNTDVTGTSWNGQQRVIHSEEFIKIDLGTPLSITFLGMLGPLGQSFDLSNNATVTVYGSNADIFSNYDVVNVPGFTQVCPVDDFGCLRFFDDIDNTFFRYWKISIKDPQNQRGPNLSIGAIYFGDYVQSGRNASNGFQKVIIDQSRISETESGGLYFDVKAKYTSFNSLRLLLMDRADKDMFERLYLKLGKTTPFFISLDPTNCITTNLYELTKLVVFNSDPIFTHVIHEIFNVEFTVREIQ